MKIDRNELDNYLTQEPPERGPTTNWEFWADEWKGWFLDAKSEFDRILRSFGKQFVFLCPDCKKPKYILWFSTGDHEDCLPF